MKTTYVLSMLSMVLMLAACSKDSGSTPMTPLTSANVDDVKKTMSSFMDVNTAVITANKNRQNGTGGSQTTTTTMSNDTSGISQLMGLSGSITDSTPAPSEKATRMASKLTEAACDITVVGLDKLQNQSGNINNVGDINASIHVGGTSCPMT